MIGPIPGLTGQTEVYMNAPESSRYVPVTLPEYMTDKQLAELLNCSRTTAWEHTNRGLLPPPYRIGRCTRWKRSEVEESIRALRAQPVKAVG